jgi:hypothetical protein
MVGLDVCWRHGGGAPAAQRKWQEIKDQRKAARTLQSEMKALGLTENDGEVDPRDALAEELSRSYAWWRRYRTWSTALSSETAGYTQTPFTFRAAGLRGQAARRLHDASV